MTACQDNTIGAVLETDGTTCESVVVEEMTYVPVTPESLQFHQELTPQHEGAVFSVQPKLRAYDSLVSVQGKDYTLQRSIVGDWVSVWLVLISYWSNWNSCFSSGFPTYPVSLC